MNWPLPAGWTDQVLKNQSVEEFAAWMVLQDFATKGHCHSCGCCGGGTSCPGIWFPANDGRCKAYSYSDNNYIPQRREEQSRVLV